MTTPEQPIWNSIEAWQKHCAALEATIEQLQQQREKALKVLAGGIAGDGKPLDLDTYQERVVAALAYLNNAENNLEPPA